MKTSLPDLMSMSPILEMNTNQDLHGLFLQVVFSILNFHMRHFFRSILIESPYLIPFCSCF